MCKNNLLSLLCFLVLLSSCSKNVNENPDSIESQADFTKIILSHDVSPDLNLNNKIEVAWAEKKAEAIARGEYTEVLKSSASVKTKDITINSNMIAQLNQRLASQNIAISSATIEYPNRNSITLLDDSQNNFLLDSQFVLNDPRREGRNNLEYNSFTPFTFANAAIPTDAIQDEAFAQYYNSEFCENSASLNLSGIDRVPNNETWNSVIFNLVNEDGSPLFGQVVSDINTVGWLPGFVFQDLLGLPFTPLGVAFTFVYTDENGGLTDINNDRFNDTAFVEIFYNDDVNWTEAAPTNPNSLDVHLASIITHEQGHSLGLDHFGTLYSINGNIQYVPKAVMNAFYLGGDNSQLRVTDKGSYCFIYNEWD